MATVDDLLLFIANVKKVSQRRKTLCRWQRRLVFVAAVLTAFLGLDQLSRQLKVTNHGLVFQVCAIHGVAVWKSDSV